jgi:hypothetical protein
VGVEDAGEAALGEIALGLVEGLPEGEAALPVIEAGEEDTRIEAALAGGSGATEVAAVGAEALLLENKEGKRLVSNGCAEAH